MSKFPLSKSKSSKPSAGYQIGYGKPPKHSQFQPGKSGNPKGRPRGSKSISTLLDRALSGKIAITEGGKTTQVEKRTAVIFLVVAKALKGDRHGLEMTLRLMQTYDASAADYEEMIELVEDENNANATATLADAERFTREIQRLAERHHETMNPDTAKNEDVS